MMVVSKIGVGYIVRKFVIFFMALIGISGCEETVATGQCPAAKFQERVGAIYDPSDFILPNQNIRVIRPGQPVTKDYRPDRMNIGLDEHDRITAIACG